MNKKMHITNDVNALTAIVNELEDVIGEAKNLSDQAYNNWDSLTSKMVSNSTCLIAVKLKHVKFNVIELIEKNLEDGSVTAFLMGVLDHAANVNMQNLEDGSVTATTALEIQETGKELKTGPSKPAKADRLQIFAAVMRENLIEMCTGMNCCNDYKALNRLKRLIRFTECHIEPKK